MLTCLNRRRPSDEIDGPQFLDEDRESVTPLPSDEKIPIGGWKVEIVLGPKVRGPFDFERTAHKSLMKFAKVRLLCRPMDKLLFREFSLK